MKHCKNYCGSACIDGSCPNAQCEAADMKWGYGIAEDMGLEKVKCKDCGYYKGCEDCFNNSLSDGRICDLMGKRNDREYD